MLKNQMGTTRFTLVTLYRQQFDSDVRRMSAEIKCKSTDIERALTAEGARATSRVFECLLRYCLRNNIGIDEVLQSYNPEF